MGFPDDELEAHASFLEEHEQLSAFASADEPHGKQQHFGDDNGAESDDNGAESDVKTAVAQHEDAGDAELAAALARSYEEAEAEAAAAAAWSDAPFFEDPTFVSCQICMDMFLLDEAVTKLCGKECVAEICAECLVQHLTASVYSFYPGVLPKVRCPVCLNLMNKNVWKKFVKPDAEVTPAAAIEATAENEGADEAEEEIEAEAEEEVEAEAEVAEAVATGAEAEAEVAEAVATGAEAAGDDSWRFDHSHVLDKYEILCRQSCEFQSPCCHNPEYTMLPSYTEQAATPMTLPRSQAAQMATLRKRCRAFCYHREDTKVFYDFIFDSFSENAEAVLWNVLSKITDEERRATLLLYHLFLHPDTRTHCCDEIVCFKCKASVHHNGQCSDFIEDDCVLQCRGCHVTLVKVDGCDSVSCVCGHSIHWPSEVAKQRAQRKQLVPSDDTQYTQWLHWTHRARKTLQKIESLEASKREIRLSRLIREKRVVLREMLLRYKSRKEAEVAAAEQQQQDDEEEREQSCPVLAAEEEEGKVVAVETAAVAAVA